MSVRSTSIGWILMSDTVADPKGKKRRAETSTAKGAPPTKKAAISGPTTTAPKAVSVVKKDGKAVMKDAKSDSSFFSKPKPTKKEMPSFKKNPPPSAPLVKKEPEISVAQPSSFNPFEDILKSYGSNASAGSSVSTPPPVSASVTPSTSGATVAGSATPTGFTKKGRPKQSVKWAADDKLEQVKLIERAVYDDDLASVSTFRSHLRMYCTLIRRDVATLHRARIQHITSATLTETKGRRYTPIYSTSKSSGQSHNVSRLVLIP